MSFFGKLRAYRSVAQPLCRIPSDGAQTLEADGTDAMPVFLQLKLLRVQGFDVERLQIEHEVSDMGISSLLSRICHKSKSFVLYARRTDTFPDNVNRSQLSGVLLHSRFGGNRMRLRLSFSAIF